MPSGVVSGLAAGLCWCREPWLSQTTYGAREIICNAEPKKSLRAGGDGYDAADTLRRVKAILVGSAGNLIEWYDVYVFAAFQLYFVPAFFANQSPSHQQIFASIVFALGFLARPFGVVFGAIADRYGRRNSR